MPKPKENLLGNKYGILLVKEPAPSRKGKTRWKCECRCGNFIVVYSTHLKKGRTKSCGCLKKKLRANKKDKLYTGNRHGDLFVWGYAGGGRYVFTCGCTLCSAGTLHIFKASEVKSGQRTSCQGIKRAVAALRLEHRRELVCYQGMIRRTSDATNKNYENVNVAEEWLPENGGFPAFLDYMLRSSGPCPPTFTIHRIGGGDYKPGSVRWASKRDQTNERSISRHLTFMGRQINLVDFAKEIGWTHSRVARYLNRGRTPEMLAAEAEYVEVTI
jgi:hypothetical protein